MITFSHGIIGLVTAVCVQSTATGRAELMDGGRADILATPTADGRTTQNATRPNQRQYSRCCLRTYHRRFVSGSHSVVEYIAVIRHNHSSVVS